MRPLATMKPQAMGLPSGKLHTRREREATRRELEAEGGLDGSNDCDNEPRRGG